MYLNAVRLVSREGKEKIVLMYSSNKGLYIQFDYKVSRLIHFNKLSLENKRRIIRAFLITGMIKYKKVSG